MRRRWGERKLSDEKIRQIRSIVKTLPRCEKTDREVGIQFRVGHAIVRKIALGWMTPRDPAPDSNFHARE